MCVKSQMHVVITPVLFFFFIQKTFLCVSDQVILQSWLPQLLMELLRTIKVFGHKLLSAAMSPVVLFHRKEPM